MTSHAPPKLRTPPTNLWRRQIPAPQAAIVGIDDLFIRSAYFVALSDYQQTAVVSHGTTAR